MEVIIVLKAHEILGTDKPIFKEKENTCFFLDEITTLGENPEDYEVIGYVQILVKKIPFFKAVYKKHEKALSEEN